MFAALSDPASSSTVNASVDAFLALAPIVYLANESSTLLKVISGLGKGLVTELQKFGLHSFFDGDCSLSTFDIKVKQEVCILVKPICASLLSLSDADPSFDNVDDFPTFLKHYPGGSAIRELLHYS